MAQFQVRKNQFTESRIIQTSPIDQQSIEAGEIIVKIDRFGYSANNITYALVGERMAYWQFFPTQGEDLKTWGVIPVWGFADVVQSNAENIPVGERLFGYFPPATSLKMRPKGNSPGHFIDASPHRSQLPGGYNIYRRVQAEPGYKRSDDNARMLLSPLLLTSFCLWDYIKDKEWYGAQQIILLSASSKTSIGLAYALNQDESAPKIIGLTSAHNLEKVVQRKLYDQSLSYDKLTEIDPNVPSIVVDLSGNLETLTRLHQHLQDQRIHSINVGITHWDATGAKNDFLKERAEFFFAPGHIQKRLKEWGPKVFEQKSVVFLKECTSNFQSWLHFETLDGLEALQAKHQAVCDGLIPSDKGLIVEL